MNPITSTSEDSLHREIDSLKTHEKIRAVQKIFIRTNSDSGKNPLSKARF